MKQAEFKVTCRTSQGGGTAVQSGCLSGALTRKGFLGESEVMAAGCLKERKSRGRS